VAILACRQCGNGVSDRAAACPSCGAKPPSAFTKCSQCGAAVSNSVSACGQCGNPFDAVSLPIAAPAVVLRNNVDTYRLETIPTEYAGFWRRFAANLVDSITVTVVIFIIPFMVGVVFGRLSPGIQSIVSLLSWIGAGLYYPLMESSSSQATLGKQMLGIMVTDERGNRIKFGRALGRYLAKILSSLTLEIGYLMAAFTARKQALHDVVAGTLVVVGKPASI
jgi:uncharacterized RDD family membrane protein YckC